MATIKKIYINIIEYSKARVRSNFNVPCYYNNRSYYFGGREKREPLQVCVFYTTSAILSLLYKLPSCLNSSSYILNEYIYKYF